MQVVLKKGRSKRKKITQQKIQKQPTNQQTKEIKMRFAILALSWFHIGGGGGGEGVLLGSFLWLDDKHKQRKLAFLNSILLPPIVEIPLPALSSPVSRTPPAPCSPGFPPPPLLWLLRLSTAHPHSLALAFHKSPTIFMLDESLTWKWVPVNRLHSEQSLASVEIELI